ncbi:MAG: hypothetical protein N4A61_01590 [Pelagimonas sp.]|jgi:hypothetical protein|nr:hypothetical protein [Pelagimonas sp.]
MMTVMKEVEITLRIPAPLYDAAHRLAQGRGDSVARLLQRLLLREVRNSMGGQKPRKQTTANDRLLAPLKVLLTADFAKSSTWPELQGRLMAKGYTLRAAEGGVSLYSHPGGHQMCKISELGHAYGDLMLRFGGPLPDHAHQWLANRLLQEPAYPGAHEPDGRHIERRA